MNHSILSTDQGLIYQFGDNAYGQISTQTKNQMDLLSRKPKIVENVTTNFGNNIYRIHAGNYASGASTDFGKENRNFYIWGGKTMIETISNSSTIKGSESTHGLGAHCRGGS